MSTPLACLPAAPAWVARRRGDKVAVDNWLPQHRGPFHQAQGRRGLRSWNDDPDDVPAFASCPVYSQTWLSAAQLARIAAAAKAGAFPPDAAPPAGGAAHEPLESLLIFTPHAAGPCVGGQQCVHGGAVGTAFDILLGSAAAFSSVIGPTAALQVTFRNKVPLGTSGTAVWATARVERKEGRKAFLGAEMRDGETGKLLASATAIFVHSLEFIMAGIKTMSNNTTTTKSATMESAAACRVPVGRPPPAFGNGRMHTREAAELVRRFGWVSEWGRDLNGLVRRYKLAERGFSFAMDSPRLRRDFLWHPKRRRFCAVVAFSKWTMGPPGKVHGGCIFAAMDDALTCFLYARGATDLGNPAGIPLTSGLSVEYKKGTPLDAIYVIECWVTGVKVDAKGRRRLQLRCAMFHPEQSGGEHKPFATGSAEFVVLAGVPWQGQALPDTPKSAGVRQAAL